MSPRRNKKPDTGWSVDLVAHLVWSKLFKLLEDNAHDQYLKSGMAEFKKKHTPLIEAAILKEQEARAPNIEKAVLALVPAVKEFCTRHSPELVLRKYPRSLY